VSRSVYRIFGYLILAIAAVATFWLSSDFFSGHSSEYVAQREVYWQNKAQAFFSIPRHLHEVPVWLKKSDVYSEMSLDAKWSVRLERFQTQSPICSSWTYVLYFETEEDGQVTNWAVDAKGACL